MGRRQTIYVFCALIGIAIGLIALWFMAGAYISITKNRAAKQHVIDGMERATIPAPTTRCLVGQRFGFAGGTSAMFGRGFFVRSTDMSAVGVTALHVLDLNGPGLILVEWFDESSLTPIGSAERVFAPPGRQPGANQLDLAGDYLLMAPDRPLSDITFLELDDRADGTRFAEPIWFPIAADSEPHGVRWIKGAVAEADSKRIDILLKDEGVTIHGTSGSPVISGTTGKVIGIVSSGLTEFGETYVFLAPIHAVREALNKPARKNRLAEINWSLHRAQEKAGP